MMPDDSQPFDLAKAKDLAKRLEAQQDKLIGLPEEFGEQFYTVWGYHAALAEIERLEAENKQMRDDLMKLAMDNRKWEKLYLEYKGNFAWIMKHFVDIKSFGSASLLFPSLFRGILQ